MTALCADRLPIAGAGLAAAAAAALAVVLAGLDLFVYDRVGDALLEQVDEVLQTQGEPLVSAVAAGRLPALSGDERTWFRSSAAEPCSPGRPRCACRPSTRPGCGRRVPGLC